MDVLAKEQKDSMKKIIASAGLVALGAASMQAAGYAPGFASTDSSQPWSISATLRGFYDDNYLTREEGSPGKRNSYGFSISPSGSVAWSADQTDLGARYTFTAYYFDDRRHDPWDYAHQFDGYLNHTFSPRLNVYVTDSFVYSAEPQVLDPMGGGTPFRTQQDNLRNTAQITANAQLTQLLTLVLGYANTIYDYQQKGAVSYSALLDRMEHLGLVNVKWQLSPQTVGVVGYNFGMIDYTGNESIWGIFLIKSSIRNSYNHYGYAGLDHAFNPDLTASVRAGVQYADFYNQSGFSQTSPYGNVNLRYRYGANSYVNFGFQQQFNQTDVLANNSSASVFYASVNHAFTPRLVGSLIGQYAYSEFNGQVAGIPSSYDGKSQNQYGVGVNLAYHFDRHFSAEIGYNYDKLDSSLPGRNYDRNRVYFGVTAAY
jgi:hypothetical protein